MASIPDLTEQIKVYETKAYLISPMLQYLLKWVGERQCTNCAQKLKWKGHFSFGSTQNHKSWTAIARLFLIRDLLHFVNSIANSNQKEQQIKKRKWICLYLIYYGTTSFSIYFGASTYSTRTTYALGKDFLNLPLRDCRLVLFIWMCVILVRRRHQQPAHSWLLVLCNQALPEQGKKQVQLQWVISPSCCTQHCGTKPFIKLHFNYFFMLAFQMEPLYDT